MSDLQEKVYHAEAVQYLAAADFNTHAVWRDLERSGLEYTREGRVNWTTYDMLDQLLEIHKAKRDPNRGKKLTEFAPGVSKKWIELCEQADRRLQLKINIKVIQGRQQ